MMDEQTRLYAEQMSYWFRENDLLTKQIKGTIEHHKAMAHLNEEQLALQAMRTELATAEYNEWALKNGLPTRE